MQNKIKRKSNLDSGEKTTKYKIWGEKNLPINCVKLLFPLYDAVRMNSMYKKAHNVYELYQRKYGALYSIEWLKWYKYSPLQVFLWANLGPD